jgi:hypothetical protein
VVEVAILGFLKKAVAGHEAENPIERRLMRFTGASEMFDRLRLAGLDEIGNAELGDCADCAAQGRADHDAGEAFGFLLGHDFQLEYRIAVSANAQRSEIAPGAISD